MSLNIWKDKEYHNLFLDAGRKGEYHTYEIDGRLALLAGVFEMIARDKEEIS